MRLLRRRGFHAPRCEVITTTRHLLTASIASFKPPLSSRPVSSSTRMDTSPAAYNRWTRDSLVSRITALENALKAQKLGIPPVEPGEPTQKRAKKARVLDRSKYSTRFIALKLAYIGKHYNGFEYQASGRTSTIEEELWKALVKACLVFPNPARPHEVDWSVCEYSKCGRTDRGVSAFGQVVALRVRSNKPAPSAAGSERREPVVGDDDGSRGRDGVSAQGKAEISTTTTTEEGSKDVSMADEGVDNSSSPAEEARNDNDDDAPFPLEKEIQYCRMLNRILPSDIRVYAWCPDPGPDFSARFNCRERQYRYFFTQPAFAPLPNFLEDGDFWQGNGPTSQDGKNKEKKRRTRPKDGWLDIDAMRQAAKLFEGLHDFRNFCKVDASKQITNFSRRIFEADIVEVDGVDARIPYLTGPQFRDPTIVPSDDNSNSNNNGNDRYPKVYYFHVRGSAFLWHQIRCMVAVLFLVGQGLEAPSVVSALLDTAAHPRRPNYVLAEDAPLVLWDCLFGRDQDEGAADALRWIYVGGAGGPGGAGDGPLNLHGPGGLSADLWERWHARKMDEILAGQLVDWLAHKTEVHRVPTEDEVVAAGDGGQVAKMRAGRSTRVYEGGNGARFAGQYVPVLQKDLSQSPEEMNDRFAQRKGFKNAEEMRARGNWREVIRAAKNGEEVEGVLGTGDE